jgi:hypothetical protein
MSSNIEGMLMRFFDNIENQLMKAKRTMKTMLRHIIKAINFLIMIAMDQLELMMKDRNWYRKQENSIFILEDITFSKLSNKTL